MGQTPSSQPGQGFPGVSGFPQQPFFGNSNPFFQQQPFFNNGGFGFPGSPGTLPGNFPQGFPQGGFGQGFPQGGFQQYPQFGYGGRNVILQNNGKQYLVQPLSEDQRVVQKNGKQYLLQPLTSNNAAASNGNYNTAALPTFNVPDAALAGLNSPFGQNAALTSQNPGQSAGSAGFNFAGNPGVAGAGLGFNGAGLNPGTGVPGANAALTAAPAGFSANQAYPPYASAQPSNLVTNAKLNSVTPQRVLVSNNGQKFEFEQIPIRNGQSQPYLSSAVGAVAAQLAAQSTGRQYAYHYVPLGLSDAYSRANQAGYGQYPTNRGPDSASEPIKRETKKTS